MYLSPKEGNTLTINNETVLATSTEGLGIRFSEENSTNALNLYNWTTINPTIVNGTGKLKIQSQLVTNKSAEDLTSGPFKAAVSLMIDYL